jgi:hypothetical protein
MALILWFVQPEAKMTAFLGLLALTVFLIIPALQLPFVRDARAGVHRKLSRGIAVILVLVGVVWFGLYVWPAEGLGVKQRPAQKLPVSVVDPSKADPGAFDVPSK